ncbi:MAG: hypothetical protein CVU43_11195 [Chloroflexi bacterium HGW-Chloroflexi-5]|jgi:DNA-binding PadR family transcriptional regulator|nr:MAG: hypothetical protein CVU43_11195 [Chloroflexi bacterium HGW-Chloroflexi-5]
MSLEHAILGFLNYEPMTGYELKKMIDVSINHFWPAVQSQIYKTLFRMEADGWLSVETISQETRPPRKVYTITLKGQNEFLGWLETPQPHSETRIAWLIQLFFAGQMTDEKILTNLRTLLAGYQQRLQAFTEIPDDNREKMKEDDPRDQFFWMLTADFGVAQTIGQVQWLTKVIHAIENHNYTLPTLGKFSK